MTVYPNGQVPTAALAKLGNYDPLFGAPPEGGYVQREAKRQLTALQNAFYAHFKKPLEVSEGYRSYARQFALRVLYLTAGGNLAAVPGTSIHGWALACDFGSGVADFGSPEKLWMDDNAPDYGWDSTGNSFPSPEAWHFDYVGSPRLIAPVNISLSTASSAVPIPIETPLEMEFDMASGMYKVNKASTKATATGIPVGWVFQINYDDKTIRRVDEHGDEPSLAARLAPGGKLPTIYGDTARKLVSDQKYDTKGTW